VFLVMGDEPWHSHAQKKGRKIRDIPSTPQIYITKVRIKSQFPDSHQHSCQHL
jgi:hypothetical protein